MSLNNRIFTSIQEHEEQRSDKISIIGAGLIGMATAVSILGLGITKNLVIVDAFGQKVQGEVMDLQHASLFLKNIKIHGGNDFLATRDSKLSIITASVRAEEGESRLSLAQRNADIIVKLIPEIVKYSPNTIILTVCDPNDILTYVAWKVSGLPHHKVIGIGTVLDTQRFKVLIAEKFQVNPANAHAWLIGEHGQNSFVLWNSVNICGVRIKQLNPLIGTESDPEKWIKFHQEVIDASKKIQELKGHSNWGTGMCVADIARSIIGNKLRIFPTSVNAKGRYGITDDVFLPLPTVLGNKGVCDIVNINLSQEELKALKDTAKLLKSVQDGIVIKGASVDCRCMRCRT